MSPPRARATLYVVLLLLCSPASSEAAPPPKCGKSNPTFARSVPNPSESSLVCRAVVVVFPRVVCSRPLSKCGKSNPFFPVLSHPGRVPLYLVLCCFCLVQRWSSDSSMLCKCSAMVVWWMKSGATRWAGHPSPPFDRALPFAWGSATCFSR